MARKLLRLGVTDGNGLRLIIEALLEPTTQMVDAAWDLCESQAGEDVPAHMVPTALYRAMLRAALLDLIDDSKQYADTDGLAKQHAMLHDYLHRAGIEEDTEF